MKLQTLFLILLASLIFWLVTPLAILPPVAAYVGYRSYRRRRHEYPLMSRSRILVGMLPMLLAFAAVPLLLYAINAGYRA
jgi:hypothetical protein